MLDSHFLFSTPKGSRIPVASVKGRCPRPLDDGGLGLSLVSLLAATFLNISNIFDAVNVFGKKLFFQTQSFS